MTNAQAIIDAGHAAYHAAQKVKNEARAPARANKAYAFDKLNTNSTFLDAVDGIKLLISWDGMEIINRAAFDFEIQRAMRAGNAEAAMTGVERDHTNWGEDYDTSCGAHTMSDGSIIRKLMFKAGVVGDWFFNPAMEAAALVYFFEFE